MNERIAILEELVRSGGDSTWTADRSRESLELLGLWFAEHVETRPKTEAELTRAAGPMKIQVSSSQLTKRTLSLAFDVGVYLAETMVRTKPGLEWTIERRKKMIDEGEPVLSGFTSVPFNPIRTVIGFAHGLAAKRKDHTMLLSVFDNWMEKT